MATLAAVVQKHYKKKDGTYNIQIRVTHNREVCYFSTQHYVTGKQISKNLTRIKDPVVLDAVNLQIAALRKEITKISYINKYTAKGLAEYLKNIDKRSEGINFIEFAEQIYREVKNAGRISTASAYLALTRHLSECVKSSFLDCRDITVKFLQRFESYLRKQGVGSRGIESNLVSLRTIFRRARMEFNDEENGVIRIVNNPFEFYRIPKSADPEKRALSVEMVRKIRDYRHIRGKFDRREGISRAELARDVFMLSFYLCGMNSKDLFLADKFEDGRIIYNRSKTANRRNDHALISIKVEPEAMEILEKYRSGSKKRIFDFYTRYSDERTFNSNLNKGLKVVGKAVGIEDLEFYAARHSWATIAANDCGYSVEEIGFCLNHALSKIVTYKYIKKDFSKIDKINRDVLNSVGCKSHDS